MPRKPLLIIEFLAEGHRCLHVRHLVRSCHKWDFEHVRFLLPRELRENVETQLSPEQGLFFKKRVDVIEEHPAWLAISKRLKNKQVAQVLFVEYLNLRTSKEQHLLYLYFESVIYQTAFCPIPRFSTSGLMFRPTFHYQQRRMLTPGAKSKGLFLLKWLTSRACSKRRGIESLYLFDPLARDHAVARWRSEKFKLVPDPLGPSEGDPRPMGFSHSAGSRPLIFLIAGALAPRKGLHSTVDALIGTTEETRSNLHLRIVGRPESGYEEYVAQNLERLRKLGIQVIADLRFVSDGELDEQIRNSDIVLTPYRGFKGSSGILIRAAHFGKPVVSTDEGLLGYLVTEHKLGETVDLQYSKEYSRRLDAIVQSGRVSGFDPASARRFADICDPDRFARSLVADPSAKLEGVEEIHELARSATPTPVNGTSIQGI